MKDLRDKTNEVFDSFYRRLNAVYEQRAAEAPTEAWERIDFWGRCGMPADLRGRMHQLRKWRNAGEHDRDLPASARWERWRKEGPRSRDELKAAVFEIERLIRTL